MSIVISILSILFTLRIISLIISVANEKKIKKQGAIEYGKLNSIFLSLSHFVFYSLSFYEAYDRKTAFNNYSLVGVWLLAISYFVLFYVIYELRSIWTVKIYILPEHKIITSLLFRAVRHPNYFLNIVPELIGVGLLCNSWTTMTYVLPVYFIFLGIRIVQEEKAMKKIRRLSE